MPIEKKRRKKVFLCVKDIENITNRKSAAARRLLSRIRKKFGKEGYELVTVREFCLYTGADEETIQELLSD